LDVKFLLRACRKNGRNFKSTALVRGAIPPYMVRAESREKRGGDTEVTVAKITLAALVLAACPAAGMAQSGTPAEQAACRPDTRRFCREFVGNEMAVLACLQQNRAKLTRACREVLERHGR
jgi:hypothetical protein